MTPRDQQGPASVLWAVERLDAAAVCRTILPYRLGAGRGDGEVRLGWIDATSFGIGIARGLGRLLGWRVEPLVFRLRDIRDPCGRQARMRMAHEDLFEVLDEIRAACGPAAFRGDGPARHRAAFILRRSMEYVWFAPDTVWRLMCLIQAAHWCSGGRPAVLFVSRRLWRPQTEAYARRWGVRLVDCGRLRRGWKQVLKDRFGEGRLRRMYHRMKARLRGVPVVRSAAEAGALRSSRPSIFVESYGHLQCDDPALYSDLFFWQASPLEGRDLVVGFGLPSDPVDAGRWAALRRHGMRAVGLHPGAVRTPEVPLFLGSGRLPRSTPPAEVPERLRGFFARQGAVYDDLLVSWRELFAATGTRVYLSWYKYDGRHYAIGDAVRSLGGVCALYQRAFETDPSPQTMVISDVFFGCSPFSAGVEAASGSRIPYYVVTGYLGDHRFALLKEPAAALRRRLREAGAERILAYFDENSTPDTRWDTGHDLTRENYRFILEKVLDDPRLGLVIKPKVAATLRRRLGPVAALLAEAEATGRCRVIESGRLHTHHPPALAALAADVAVHGHLCAVTAAFEAALTGTPTFLLDREGWPESPLARLGRDRFVFTEWETLWRACEEVWAGGPPPREWDGLLDQWDPFRDGRAAERMGAFLGWILDGFRRGGRREAVLAEAVGRYEAVWGRGRVLDVGGGTAEPIGGAPAESIASGGRP